LGFCLSSAFSVAAGSSPFGFSGSFSFSSLEGSPSFASAAGLASSTFSFSFYEGKMISINE